MTDTFLLRYSNLDGVSNVIFLDHDGKRITRAEFDADIHNGYQSAVLLVPVEAGLQHQVVMQTAYRNEDTLDLRFVVENFNEFVRNSPTHRTLKEVTFEQMEYLIGVLGYD